eukprot:CAMPEP_0197177902 /NCGR_PEP_ID=MMETSP1423-20130617/3344_1 /TAXON_ID=476441 /ORGANISM="Pseudo-nitzschia heimii, Strain UNC1101" /LENGTH=469 /DNA_ID=CAMNT_0042627523 /DNA_START=71 /DNA_END=1481 /DNA_ORIENTATION=+
MAMILFIIISLAILQTIVGVSAPRGGGIRNDEKKWANIPDFSNEERRLHAHLPKFSKKAKGIGSHAYYSDTIYNGQEWVLVGKSEKSYKDSKKDKKEGKKEKKEKKNKVLLGATNSNPDADDKAQSDSIPAPSIAPTVRNNYDIGNGSGSGSEDMVPTSENSEDCPPERPPTVIPPPTATAKEAPVIAPTPNPQIGGNNVKHVDVEIFAIDYTLFQTDRAPIKVDFLELQKITETYFRDHMVDAYKISTQANLVDFTTSFVTAHFTPGEPIHVQYNSTASFDENSMTLPTSEVLYSVLVRSLENSKPYIDRLKSDLNSENPFSSTTSAIFTYPKDTPATRNATSTNSVVGIVGAGVVMSMILSIFVCVIRRRNVDDTVDNECNGSFSKQICGDTTIAGDTFIIESNDDTYDSGISILTSIDTKELSVKSNIRRHRDDVEQTSNVIQTHRKPRTVAEVENLLMLEAAESI